MVYSDNNKQWHVLQSWKEYKMYSWSDGALYECPGARDHVSADTATPSVKHLYTSKLWCAMLL